MNGKIKNPKLYIAYFYKPDGDNDACTFIADPDKNIIKQFLKYANEWQGWDIKECDIDGIYGIREEEDGNGNKYKIKV